MTTIYNTIKHQASNLNEWTNLKEQEFIQPMTNTIKTLNEEEFSFFQEAVTQKILELNKYILKKYQENQKDSSVTINSALIEVLDFYIKLKDTTNKKEAALIITNALKSSQEKTLTKIELIKDLTVKKKKRDRLGW